MNALQRALTVLASRDRIAAFHAAVGRKLPLASCAILEVIFAVNQASYALETLSAGQCEDQRHCGLVRDARILRSEQLLH